MRWLLQIAILFLAVSGCVALGETASCPSSGPCISPQPELPEITSGQHVTVKGDHLPITDTKVRLSTGRDEDKPFYREAIVHGDGKALTFLADVPHGNYLVYIVVANKEPGLSVPGDLRVVADSDAPVRLTAIHPLTQYPSAKHGNYDLLLVGENFARNPEDNIIEVVGRGA
jgi:hypothetical protein